MIKSIVEQGVDLGNSEDKLALANLGPGPTTRGCRVLGGGCPKLEASGNPRPGKFDKLVVFIHFISR